MVPGMRERRITRHWGCFLDVVLISIMRRVPTLSARVRQRGGARTDAGRASVGAHVDALGGGVWLADAGGATWRCAVQVHFILKHASPLNASAIEEK